MKNHLKRLTVPNTWGIDRKSNKFIMKPSPGPHKMESSLPLGVVLRDFLGYAHTTREAKKILNNNEILIDGKRRKDSTLPVGLFDVISFPNKDNFRVVFDEKGRLAFKKMEVKENNVKPCKILGKKMLSKTLQLNLHDGTNLLVEKDFKGKVGDTVLLAFPERKVKEVFALKEGSAVFIYGGKKKGDLGILKSLSGNKAVYEKDKQEIETLKSYLFVVGDKKQSITI